MDSLAFATLADLSAGLRQGSYSSVEITQHFLERIARLDEAAHAYVDVFGESALLQSEAADLQRRSGLPVPALHGVPIALKDIFQIAGKKTSEGLLVPSKPVDQVTSTVVERLQAAGMILLGKNHLVEFCFGGWGLNPFMGTPRNPWDAAVHRVPGGSSSGSAVAVAAGLAPAAVGSDTGGSVRIPAAFNGLTGLKPTRGLISTFGVLPFVSTLDSVGTLTRTAVDAALLTEALAGFDPRDPATELCRQRMFPIKAAHCFRVAVMRREQYPSPVSDEVFKATEAAVAIFRSAGHVVEDVAVPLDFAAISDQQGLVTASEAYAAHIRETENPGAEIGPGVRRRLLFGKGVDAASYFSALAYRRDAVARFQQWMESYDFLITPTVPFTAPPTSDVDDDSMSVLTFVRWVSFLGSCAISLPSGLSEHGLPMGVQLIAKPWQENILLSAAAFFQQQTDWHRLKPTCPNSSNDAY